MNPKKLRDLADLLEEREELSKRIDEVLAELNGLTPRPASETLDTRILGYLAEHHPATTAKIRGALSESSGRVDASLSYLERIGKVGMDYSGRGWELGSHGEIPESSPVVDQILKCSGPVTASVLSKTMKISTQKVLGLLSPHIKSGVVSRKLHPNSPTEYFVAQRPD